MLGCVGLSAGAYSSRRVLHPRVADKIPSLGPATAQNQPLALAKYFPTLVDPRAKSGPLIINSFDGRGASLVGRGEPGNAIFVAPGHDRAIIPWTPLFAREQTILRPPQSVTRKLGGADLLVWNESSREHSIYGNKARKYEFMLPNLQWSKVRRTATVGAVSSNHVLQFALANRLADLTGSGEPLNSELDLVLFEVPGVPTDERRLAILQQLSPRVVVASNMFGLAGEIAYELANRQMDTHPQALIPPGGSNELSVLGHMNAVADLAQALETSQAWNAPPDVIVVAMGSGSTVLGLLLGVHLMKWNTQIVGVADQDRSYVSRFLANQHPSVPFVQGNVAKLAGKAMDWLNASGFPGLATDADGLLRRDAFLPDSTSWEPGYGLTRSTDIPWRDELASAGIGLDPVFTQKAWRSLVSMAETGALKGKRVLFWNTYNAFDYAGYVPSLSAGSGDVHAAL